MNYHDIEEEIFEEWISLSETNNDGGEDEFAQDGLLYRGDIVYTDKGFWERHEGNEESLWEASSKRIMFLTKDLNDPGNPWDIRCETGRKNKHGKDIFSVNTLFYKNYMRMLYGILNAQEDNSDLSYDTVNNPAIYQPFFDKVPIVRINCKKQVGGNSLKNSELIKYLRNYKDILLKQINLYDANIIVCCGGSSIIKEFVAKNYITDLIQINSWIYYSESCDKLVIDAFHLSYPGSHYKDAPSEEEAYTWMMDALKEFYVKYKK